MLHGTFKFDVPELKHQCNGRVQVL